MASALNGIILHGWNKYFVSAFFVLYDSLCSVVLSKIPSIYVLMHDFVVVGEDSPIPESIEKLSNCHGMENVIMMRLMDANEVVTTWKILLESEDWSTL